MTIVFFKELRDVLRWVPPGIVVMGMLCWMEVPEQLTYCSIVRHELVLGTIYASSLFAFALGLLQSLFDLRPVAREFLLHRPVSPGRIFWSKLAAGFVGHTLIWLIPLSLMALYLESLGPEQKPLSWLDTVPAAICCLVSFSFHPAAMWMVCRDARWIGTKCLPLVLPLVACRIFVLISYWQLPLETEKAAVFVLIIGGITLSAAKHAFAQQTFLPVPSSAGSWSWAGTTGLTLSTTFGLVLANVYLSVEDFMVPEFASPTTPFRVAVSTDGQLWQVEVSEDASSGKSTLPVTRRGRLLSAGQANQTEFADLDDAWQECHQVHLSGWNSGTSGDFPHSYVYAAASGNHALYERNGRLYIYDRSVGRPRLIATVTPLGAYGSNETPEGRFRNVWSLFQHLRINAAEGQKPLFQDFALLVDAAGIYRFEFDSGTICQLTEHTARVVAVDLPTDDRPDAMLWAWDHDTIRRFAMVPVSSDQPVQPKNPALFYAMGKLNLIPNGEWSLAWIENPEDTHLSISVTDNGTVVFVAESSTQNSTCRFGRSDGTLSRAITLPASELVNIDVLYPLCPMPPVLVAAADLYVRVFRSSLMNARVRVLRAAFLLGRHRTLVTLITLHALLAAIGAALLARHRGCSGKACAWWAMVGLLVGVPVWVTVIAVYPRGVTEQCTDCDRPRRIDLDRCEHCGIGWEMSQPDGTQLIGL